MGYWEEKAKYEAQKELEEGSQEFYFEEILDISPKEIKRVFDFLIKDDKNVDNEEFSEEVINHKKPHSYKSILKQKGLFGGKVEFSFELKELKTKIRLIVTYSLKSWIRYYSKDELEEMKKFWINRVKELYDIFSIKESKFDYCHKCGSKFESNAKFCHKCGIKIIVWGYPHSLLWKA